MLAKLIITVTLFLRTKYVYTQGNYSNARDWMNKTGINRLGSWATDLEVFAASLLLNIDILVFLGPSGTRWVGFSGKGSNFGELMKEPIPIGIYIQNLGNLYEPIISVKSKNHYEPIISVKPNH